MLMLEIAGGAIVLGLAFAYNPGGTMKLLTTVISVRGGSWLAKKILHDINIDAAQFIDLAGWSIAGISIIKILKNSLGSVGKVRNFFGDIAEFLDKITFWN